MVLTPEQVRSILKPVTYTTDDFVNDTITFNIDDRFRQTSIVKQLDIKNSSERDGTDKLIIDFGKTDGGILSVRMYSPTYNEYKIAKQIKSNFEEFIPPTTEIMDFSNLGPSQSEINAVDNYLTEGV